MTIKRLQYTFLPLLLAALLGGCNTMEGLGKDIAKGGEALENAADKANK